ncbi:DNA cytosine methyltransferase [Rossellomorea vietnamensis]|uniref:DNA (cytosine-5-)-methyltransferase n=1 Tax=Rossellomorea vietnamensis TaxID=218284 RepID=A0A5D4NJU4_9BACI|nr:DNA cytosine methyltransferase [Rossellomorea vietnamensis]TYS14290.1 DNA cytosine methyltransferase [Rossellomorea vietnamensis]
MIHQLDLFREIIVDNFAGGGGASTGIEMATGLSVDIAINHDPAAIAMHKANHPDTEHYCESVWDVDPVKAVKGRKVGLAWFSPDCKHFSKAKGGKPVEKKIRGLAWIAVKWAIAVRPRVIMLENVEEFKTWGPLNDGGYPDETQKGKTFKSFVKALTSLGYQVEFKEMSACDYGAPTTRKRFFMVARCDEKPIVWPDPSHGDPTSIQVQAGKIKPWRTAAEIIDWSIEAPSIFARKKPLAENTLLRISRGIQKFVIEAENPYVVDDKAHFIQHYYTHQGKETRGSSLYEPIATIPTANRFGLVTAFLAKHYGGNYTGAGISLENPLHTITAVDHHALVTAFLTKYYGQGVGQGLNEPIHTIPTKDRFGLVTAFMMKYYGTNIGHRLSEPLHTITAGGNKFALITVNGENYQITDIGMRMLQPRELYNGNGFPGTYIIDRDYKGDPYPKTAQVARCGNSVPPPFAYALTRANLPEYCYGKSRYNISVAN